MARAKQLQLLKSGSEVWNQWRKNNTTVGIDLRRADLSGVDLSGADLQGVDFCEVSLARANLHKANLKNAKLIEANLFFADLSEANLNSADLSEASLRNAHLVRADLSDARLIEADLWGADLDHADLSRAKLNGVNLTGANLSKVKLNDSQLIQANLRKANLNGADLSNADLTGVTLVGTEIDGAKVSGSRVYEINVWDVTGKFEEQKDLVITPHGSPIVTVDNIKVAQFIYSILNNEEIREVINTLTSKSVLILGRFTIPERKAVLDALRNKLREYDLLPIVFDFDRPTDKDFTETIKTLAGLSYFVIADITNPKSSPLELQATVPDYQIPFVPIIQEGEFPFAMMVDLQKKYPWVLDTLTYDSIGTLINSLKPAILDPAIKKHNELRLIKAREPKIRSAKDFLEK